MLYSGIDLHKRTLAIHTIDAAGTLVRKLAHPDACWRWSNTIQRSRSRHDRTTAP